MPPLTHEGFEYIKGLLDARISILSGFSVGRSYPTTPSEQMDSSVSAHQAPRNRPFRESCYTSSTGMKDCGEIK